MKTRSIASLAAAAAATLVTGSGSTAWAGNQYMPEIRMGVNLSETRTIGPCIKGTKIDTRSTGSAMNRIYTEHRIHNRAELHSVLGIDASFSAKSLWGSANANFKKFSESTFSSNHLYWLIDASYETSTESIPNTPEEFDLTDDAKAILKIGIKQFYEACGTHYYSGRRIGARYSVLYEFSSDSANELDQLEASARANYRGIVKGNVSLKSLIERSSANNSLRVSSLIIGGDHKLDDYANDPEALKEQLAKLREQLSIEKKGEPLEWFITSYDHFKEVAKAKALDAGQNNYMTDELRNSRLASLYEQFQRNATRVRDLRELLANSSGENPLYYFSDDKIRRIENTIYALERQNSEIAILATDCINSSDAKAACQARMPRDLLVSAPKPDRDMSGLGNWTLLPVSESTLSPQKGLYFLASYTGAGTHKVSTEGKLYTDSTGNVFVRFQSSRGVQAKDIQIGTLERAPDMVKNKFQPNICVNNFKNVCRIRAIESLSSTFPDGSPAAKLELTVFNPESVEEQKFYFPFTN